MKWQDQLVDSGEISQGQLADAVSLSALRQISIQDSLLTLEYTDPRPITRAHAQHHGYPIYNFYDADIQPDIICTIPDVLFRDFHACPVLILKDVLWYATPLFDDASNQRDISAILNREMAPMWAPHSWLKNADHKYYTDTHHTRAMTSWFFARYNAEDWLLSEGNRYEEYCATHYPKLAT